MTDIRKKAEEILQKRNDSPQAIVEANTALQAIVQELHRHQIELELQNDELRITQRKLETAKDKYSELYNFAPMGYFTFDTEGVILEVNLTGARLLGLEKAYLNHKPFCDFLQSQSHPIFSDHINWVIQHKKNQICELIIIRADDSVFFAQMESIVTVDEQGEVQQCRSALMDISARTELKQQNQSVKQRTAELTATNQQLQQEILKHQRTEKALHKAKEVAEAANHAKSVFLANMNHELRAPLNAILGISQTFQEEIYGEINDRQRHCMQTLESSGHHLLALISDILDLSKIEAEKLKIELDVVSVNDVCQASLQMIKKQALKKQLKISFCLDYTVDIIQADHRRLKQILVNLLSNAVKFTPSGGEIGLEVNGIKQDRIDFSVWDTGIGIAETDKQRLFYPFVQVDGELNRACEGTGLGLALVRRLTEMHGGNVSVESEVGKGSRFIVSLPWHSMAKVDDKKLPMIELEPKTANDTHQPAMTIALAPETANDTHRPVILLAEDNPTNLEIFSDYLTAKGYQLILASNGVEAIQQAQAAHPALILMDIQMPIMNGQDAIREIRANAEIATIPIIALTAHSMQEDRERFLKMGANDYLSKPVKMNELVAAINMQLQP